MRRILVAEDDPALRLLYALWLEGAGCDVVACSDGREAIAELERGLAPDAAVLDVDMPYVDGLSICRYLHARDAAIPIVIVSGIEDVRPAALAAGAVEVLAKPCDREDLEGSLRRARARVGLAAS
jgi:two-component system C4-dicarboxylate transport response regulator DctD